MTTLPAYLALAFTMERYGCFVFWSLFLRTEDEWSASPEAVIGMN